MAQTSALQYLFYCHRSKSSDKWKIQNKKLEHVGPFWGPPLFSSKPDRGPYHRFVVSGNLLIASIFAGLTAQLSVTLQNRMRFEAISLSKDYSWIITEVLLIVVYENVVEYYWHRLMHMKYFYATFHKYHHFYKSPEPWDDMYIHPLEATGYYCILYGPPFLFSIHYVSFFIYMIIMGICGILDHSGIKFAVPGIYNTVDHDNHHLKFEVNYAFPFPYMDILHGTFDGELMGYTFKCKKK